MSLLIEYTEEVERKLGDAIQGIEGANALIHTDFAAQIRLKELSKDLRQFCEHWGQHREQIQKERRAWETLDHSYKLEFSLTCSSCGARLHYKAVPQWKTDRPYRYVDCPVCETSLKMPMAVG